MNMDLSKIQSLGKISQSAGPSTSCDARPSAKRKVKRKSPKFQRCKATAIKQLASEYGINDAAGMLGISPSGLSTIIGKNDAALTMEKLAEMIIHNEGKKVIVDRKHVLVLSVPSDKGEAVTSFCKALGIKYVSFSE